MATAVGEGVMRRGVVGTGVKVEISRGVVQAITQVDRAAGSGEMNGPTVQ